MSQIKAPFPYFADPTKSRALFSASLYFGVPDTDPLIEANQKIVKAVQEDGTEVVLAQPVQTNKGGYPTYNGSPVRLSISGNFSFKALNSSGSLVLYAADVENIEPGSEGFSGVVIPETQTLSAGQTTVVFSTIGANESVFYLITSTGDQGVLAKNIDYTVTNSTTIELSRSYNAGDIVLGRQNDPTGQLVPVNEDSSTFYVFENFTEAGTAAVNGNLSDGDTFFLNGGPATADGLGGIKYKAIITAFSNDDVNYFDLNTTLQAELQTQYYRFKNYSEEVATASISAGVLTIDLNEGVVQEIELTENVTSIQFVNYNPNTAYSSTVTIKMTQDGTGGRTVIFPSPLIEWTGGSSPTVTAAAGATDVYAFQTYDAGTTWLGFSLGQNFS